MNPGRRSHEKENRPALEHPPNLKWSSGRPRCVEKTRKEKEMEEVERMKKKEEKGKEEEEETSRQAISQSDSIGAAEMM